MVKYIFADLGPEASTVHLQPDSELLQLIPTEQLKKNILIQQSFRHYVEEVKVYELPQKEFPLEQQNISNCFQHIHIPISSQQDLQDGLIGFDKSSIRIGKVMEHFDLIAGEIGYQYIRNNFEDATVVTACVDNIKFVENMSPQKDIHIQAYPSYVGNSSIEIQIDLYQKDNDEDDNSPLKLKTTSAFLMVARQAKDRSKAYYLPKLQIETELETQLVNEGKSRQQLRLQKKNESFYKKAPNEEQVQIIHQFFVDEQKYRSDKDQYKQMKETSLMKVLPMHFQDKNIHGNIFGGFIIRECFELGLLCGIMLNNGKLPMVKYIADFQLIKPCHIGDIVKFESRVCCVQDSLAFVNVECYRMGFDNQPIVKTNELELILQVENNTQKVYPVTYASAMKYLNGYNFINLYQKTHQ